MKKVDITQFRDIDQEYEKIVSTLEERIKGDWNDSIQESYTHYVLQLLELSRAVRTIRCKVETLAKEVEGIKADEIVKKANSLSKEAETV